MALAMAQACCHLFAAPSAASLQSPAQGLRTRQSAAGLRPVPARRSASPFSSSVSVSRRRCGGALASAEPEEKAAPSEPVAEKFSAAKYSMGDTVEGKAAPKSGELSDAMKEKMRKEYLGLGGSPNSPLKGNPFLTIIIGITVLVVLFQLFGQG